MIVTVVRPSPVDWENAPTPVQAEPETLGILKPCVVSSVPVVVKLVAEETMTGRVTGAEPSVVPANLIVLLPTTLIWLPTARAETVPPLVKLVVPLFVVIVPPGTAALALARDMVPAPLKVTVPAPETLTVADPLPEKEIVLPAGMVAC